jgi:hypothetical protein
MLESVPRAWLAVRTVPDAFAAPLALALGFSLVGVVLVLTIPLVALASLLSQQTSAGLIVSGPGFVTAQAWRFGAKPSVAQNQVPDASSSL